MASRKRKSTPHSIRQPDFNTSGRVGVASSVNAPKINYPMFSFKYIITDFDTSKCDYKQKAALIDKLMIMTQKTWLELLTSNYKSGAGFELMPKKQIRAKLPEIITDDVDKLHVIRFGGRKYRLIGHKSDHIFYVTHIDTKLSAYDH